MTEFDLFDVFNHIDDELLARSEDRCTYNGSAIN